MKKSLADRIEQYIKVLIARSEQNTIEIQRAELAETFSCVPSQITYVINTRFNEDKGFITESRRGGKGFVKITQLNLDVEKIAYNELLELLDRLFSTNEISRREKEMLHFLISHTSRNLSSDQQEEILKSVRDALISYFYRNH
ncbi:MAG: CtsR family transcriptional regulator [Syntrophomonadaceae bacterium]|jgi:transcriptional regulator CtsR